MLEIESSQAYLDCAASAPVDAAVVERISLAHQRWFANSSSVHTLGVQATVATEKSRLQLARRLNVRHGKLVFTSGGTEANNFAIKGAVWAKGPGPKHIVISAIEHPSVLAVADWLEQSHQAEVTRVGVNSGGVVDPSDVARALRPHTVLVSIMHANNETGAIQPVAAIGRLCREHGAWFHTDACQSFLRAPLDVQEQMLDLVTINAHKIHGPKGVGALYVGSRVTLSPLLHGGGHEGGARSGTVNVPAIVGFGEAGARLEESDVIRMRGLIDGFLLHLRREIPKVRVQSENAERVCHILNIAIPRLSGKLVFQELERRGIFVSTSSACHSTKLTPSHVLKAMGLSDSEANEAVRISVGRFTQARELEAAAHAIVEIAKENL